MQWFYDTIWGEQKTSQQMLRERKRDISRSCNQLKREINSMRRGEKKILGDMRRLGKQQKVNELRMKTKFLISTQKNIERMETTCMQMDGFSQQLTAMSSQATMSRIMEDVTRALKMLTVSTNIPRMKSIAREFAKQSGKMEVMQEVMDDTIDEMNDDDDDDEIDDVVDQVLAKVLIDAKINVPDSVLASQNQDTEYQKVQERFNNLTRS
jgi:hypothetical protein